MLLFGQYNSVNPPTSCVMTESQKIGVSRRVANLWSARILPLITYTDRWGNYWTWPTRWLVVTKRAIKISRVEEWQLVYMIGSAPFPKVITRKISEGDVDLRRFQKKGPSGEGGFPMLCSTRDIPRKGHHSRTPSKRCRLGGGTELLSTRRL
jgi:hypothetical protein